MNVDISMDVSRMTFSLTNYDQNTNSVSFTVISTFGILMQLNKLF